MPFMDIVAGVLTPVSGEASSWGVVGEVVSAGISLICCGRSVGSTGGKVAPVDSRWCLAAFFALRRRTSQRMMKGAAAKSTALMVMPTMPPVGRVGLGGWTRV